MPSQTVPAVNCGENAPRAFDPSQTVPAVNCGENAPRSQAGQRAPSLLIGHTHSSSYAHGSQALLLLLPFHFVYKVNRNASSRASDRVSNCDCATINVNLFWVQTQLLLHGHTLNCKSFVRFYEIHARMIPLYFI